MTVGQDSVWLSTSQAARALGVSPERIRQLMNEGRLHYQRTPIGRLLAADAVEALRAERARKAGSGLGGDDV